jgi:type I restriction-modification system DNA methylase subunit
MSSIPTHLFKKGGMTDCGCGGGSYKDGGDLDSEKKYFKGVDFDYENQFLVNKAIEELLDMKSASDMTVEEKNFLTYYSGYGGLEKFGATGKGLLYEYFTPPLIAKKMWALAYKHGFEGGLVLEPSCGIGEFIKYAPEQDLVHGYEINVTSAKIASILYPKARIKTDPFEKLFIKNNYTIKGNTKGIDNYSLVIGNPPYGSMAGLYAGMGEKEYARANNYIDYFILRGLDLLSSGGLLVYVIGTEVAAGGIPFLQQGITENKKLIAERADLVDAYRLPNGVFERTDVLTDIVVFKKK